MFKRIVALLVCFVFNLSNLQYVHAQDFSVNQLPVPGTMVGESSPFAPLALKGLVVNLQKPLEFQFIVDTGKEPQDTASIKEEASKLIKYFMAGLTIPEGEVWVNLSPYEKDRITSASLGQTELGRDLLAQDYILKQLTASLIYPEKNLGKEFWNRVYAKAQQEFGTTNISVNTFNKVWIVPDQAQVFENGSSAYVTRATLKVMLEEDYMALKKHVVINHTDYENKTHTVASQIVREIVLPELEKEVNQGRNFAPLRQIYDAMILAKWYKETVANRLLDTLYTNKEKTDGINLSNLKVKEQIYQRYLQAYKKGVFNYIEEDQTSDGTIIPKKYFSGGFTELGIKLDRSGSPGMIRVDGAMISLTASLVVAAPIVALGAVAIALKIHAYKIAKSHKPIALQPRIDDKFSEITRGVSKTTPDKVRSRRERMNATISKYNFELIKEVTPEIFSRFSKLEENRSYRKSAEKDLKLHLEMKSAIILVAKDPASGEIVGFTYGLPQNLVPETSLGQLEPLFETFFEMNREIQPSLQITGLTWALRKKLMEEATKAGFRYYSLIQNDSFTATELNAEAQDQYGLKAKIVELKVNQRIPGASNQQYAVFKLQDSAMTGKLNSRRESMENALERFRFEFMPFSQVLRDPNILPGIHLLEENMGSGRMPEPMLMGFLATQGAKILLATDPKSGEIVGFTFGLPQSSVPKKQEWGPGAQFINESFYEMSRQVLPKYQGQGVGSAMRMKLMQEAVKDKFKYFASDQNDTFSEVDLNAEMQNLYGLNGKIIYLKRGLNRRQQNLIFKLPDQAMSNAPKSRLLELMESKDNDVMFNAAGALVKILDQLSDGEKKQAMGQVVERLHNPDSIVRQKAIVTLQSLGMDPDDISQATVIGENYLRSKMEAQGRDKTDKAMQSLIYQNTNDKVTLAKNGGIDLNSISIKRTGHILQMQSDAAQLTAIEEMGFEGFTPVITNVTFISSPFKLLGVK